MAETTTYPVTVAEAKEYIRVSDEVSDDIVAVLIAAADVYLCGSIGKDYPRGDGRVKQLALLVVSDLYDNRELNEKQSANVRRLVDDFSLQLRLEMR